MPERHRALLEQHCQGCHGPEKQKGKFRVDDLPLTITDLATAERWQKVLGAMNSGEMPPEEEKQPEARIKTDFLDDLSQVMVTARKSLGDQKGVIALRRLNRREYRNTLRDLLGVSVDVSELPSDTGVQGFDTVGANLFLTGNQLEQYESLGRDALEEAFQAHESAALNKKFRLEAESIHRVALKRNRDSLDAMERVNRWIRAVDEAAARPENATIVGELRKIAKTDDALRYHWKKIPGAPSPMEFGFDKTSEVNPAGVYLFRDRTDFIRYDEYYLGLPHLDTGSYLTVTAGYGATGAAVIQGLGIPTDFPPGEYVVRIRAAATPDAPAGRRFLEFGQKGFAGGGTPAMSVHHITGTLDAPEVIEIPFTFTRQSAERKFRNLFIRERGAGDQGKIAQVFQEARKRNGFGPEAALWIDWIEIERKQTPPEATPPGIRALGSIPFDKEAAAPEPEKIRTALANFIKEAYRGTAAPEGLVDRLARIYDARRGVGDTHRDALKQTLASVLASPRFLYRAEPQPDAEHRPLNGNELATRLSYFLWGGPPDATLRALAESGELLKPEVLTAQTERLLEHPNAAQFIRPFLTQWLALDRLDLFQFHKGLYPRFDDATKSAARQEVYETFSHLLKENGRLSDLLSADYVVINAVLADYYGIAGVTGDGFRKVALPAGSPRGGLLGMAAIMAMGSNGQRTNPVERGAWVLRKLLHEPPPPAPANVPEIARLAGKLLTTRERLRAHQEDPQCASCHRKIDPIGFGLENFDAVGQWRTTDSYQALDASGAPDPGARKTWTIEAAAQLHKGPAFRDYFGLREIIASKKENFARAFTSALIEYALGRPCGFSDETLVEDMVKQAGEKSFATREFIHALVRSKEFQSK
jgi:mono/diheme cytochrome c family protein